MSSDLPPRRPIHHRRRPVLRALGVVGSVVALLGSFGPSLPVLAAVRSEDSAPRAALTGRWMGRTEAFGYPLFVECRFDGRGGGTLRGFAAAPMGFDALTLPSTPVSGATLQGDEIRFEASVRGRTVAFHASSTQGAGGAEREGEQRVQGKAGTGDETTPFHLVRVGPPLGPERMADRVGVFDLGPTRVGITWREYGDLRMIDLITGEGSTLIPLPEPGRFITRRTILEPSGPSEKTERIALRRGPDGVELRWLQPDGSELAGRRAGSLEQERIRFRSGSLELAGTVLRPSGPGPHPAAVHVHGSGPIYRTALFQRAVLFAEMGVASLIYDKRGTGASEGRWSDDVFVDLAADARAGLEAVRALPGIDPARVGYAGHSQAGYVIPIASAEAPRPGFAVIVNGGSIRPGAQSLYDKANDLRREGFSSDERERALDLMRRLYDYVEHREGDRAALERDYLAAKEREWFPVTDLPDIPAIPSWDDPPEELFRYRDEIAFDPVPYQERMGMPVLVLLGAEDQTVPATRAASIWEKSLRRAENPSFRIEIVAGADHAMRPVDGSDGRSGIGLVPEYRTILDDWLGEVLGLR